MISLSDGAAALERALMLADNALVSEDTYIQLALAAGSVLFAWFLTARLQARPSSRPMLQHLLERVAAVLFPGLCTLFLLVAAALARLLSLPEWLLRVALLVSVLWLFERIIRLAVAGPFASRALRWVGMPMLSLHILGLLGPLTTALDAMSLKIGNLHFTVTGLLRVVIFGALLFWLGWVCNSAGQVMIRRQEKLDLRTREVFAKLFQIGLFTLVGLLFLQVMGINLTALAVFGGALGVGLGFGLQSIASNFISGIILLFDRSLSVGDYVSLENGHTGYVRELSLRYTTLETFDGKMVLVPNESFITSAFTNWTHRHKKQRYRVDFSVAYRTDIRALCQLIRETVASHPQVISGPDIPFEELPDCEIDSFGDSGVNMFVEFWMEGVDDGRNRVGGDLLLQIFETLRDNGIEIPFPQREVRILPS